MSYSIYKIKKIEDICSVASSKRIYASEYVDAGVAFWRSKEVIQKANNEEISDVLYITKERFKEIKMKFGAPIKGDILLASIGANMGTSYYVNIDTDFYFKDGNVTWFNNFSENIYSKYLYFCLNWNIVKANMLNTAIGSAQKALTIESLKKLEIPIPKLDEQKAIAKILSDLDEKIEINNKINKKLEEMAQTIFKQWFVDFEFPNEDGKPYKSSSGEMVESELGMIPKGWEVILLDEIVDTFNGYSYKGKELSESEDAMITIKNFDRNGGYKMDGLKEIVISDKVKPHHFVEVNDIIVAHTDLTQGAEIIGNPIMIFSKGSYEKLIMSMDTVKVKSKIKEMNNELLYFILKDYRFKQYALGYVNGTTVLHLSKSTIPQYKIALPYDKSIMNQLGDNLSPIMSKIANNFKENEKLIMLRDTLLPKLMSGEIRVPID